MKPSPCLSPVRAWNEATGSFVFVPCGHCDACVASKGFARSSRLKDNCVGYKYQYFVTLTYDDNSLPFGCICDDTLVHSIDTDYKGHKHKVNGVSSFTDTKTLELLDYCKQHYNGRVPLLSHSHLIKFKNRFRYYLKKYCNDTNTEQKPLFIYSVGEYGPRNFRPHFHLLFCTNTELRKDIFTDLIHKAWSFRFHSAERSVTRKAYGFSDIQKCINGDAGTYVAQYLNCSTHLPLLLSRTVFRPFCTQSDVCDRELSRYEGADLRTLFYNTPVEVKYCSPLDSSIEYLPLPGFLQNRVFPKCVGFGRLDSHSRNKLYSVARFSREDFVNYWIDDFQGSFNELNKDSILGRCIKEFYFHDDKDSFARNLSKLWYISRRVLQNCDLLGISVADYVRQIDLYYSKRELYKLKNFYDFQTELLARGIPLKHLINLYYDTPDSLSHIADYHEQFGSISSSVNVFSCQREYEAVMHKIVNDTSKTKFRNDYFQSTGRKRKMFVPKFKHSILKFNSF